MRNEVVLAEVTFATCPNCGAEYPDFHSPIGSFETLCDACGWSSEEEDQEEDDQ
jgi:hypothetical protein